MPDDFSTKYKLAMKNLIILILLNDKISNKTSINTNHPNPLISL